MCANGHEWSDEVRARTIRHTQCPQCHGVYVGYGNRVVPGVDDMFGLCIQSWSITGMRTWRHWGRYRHPPITGIIGGASVMPIMSGWSPHGISQEGEAACVPIALMPVSCRVSTILARRTLSWRLNGMMTGMCWKLQWYSHVPIRSYGGGVLMVIHEARRCIQERYPVRVVRCVPVEHHPVVVRLN